MLIVYVVVCLFTLSDAVHARLRANCENLFRSGNHTNAFSTGATSCYPLSLALAVWQTNSTNTRGIITMHTHTHSHMVSSPHYACHIHTYTVHVHIVVESHNLCFVAVDSCDLTTTSTSSSNSCAQFIRLTSPWCIGTFAYTILIHAMLFHSKFCVQRQSLFIHTQNTIRHSTIMYYSMLQRA